MAARSACRRLLLAASRHQILPKRAPPEQHVKLFFPFQSDIFSDKRPHLFPWLLDSHSRAYHHFTRTQEEERAQQGEVTTEASTTDLSFKETKDLLRHAAVGELKARLKAHPQPFIAHPDAVALCKECGAATSDAEAAELVKALDAAGVVLFYQGKLYLQPHVVAQAVADALPLPLLDEGDPRVIELHAMEEEKRRIDEQARRYARRTLWFGLGFVTLQTACFFRLTFWELSWDVMEPITFFATTSTVLLSYAYFLVTSSEPTYVSFFDKLYHRRQRRLAEKANFNLDHFRKMKAERERALGQRRRADQLRRPALADDDD